MPLDCVPREVVLYLDGERIEPVPQSLELRSDRAHQLMFRSEAYETQYVWVEPVQSEGGPALAPANLCEELRFVQVERSVDIELEER